MKEGAKRLFSLLIALSIFLTACKDDDSPPSPGENLTLQVFKNTSGDPNANALQAQIVNSHYGFTLNVYGTFDNENDPEKIHAVTFRKENNDTTLYYLVNPLDGKLQSMYMDVRGEKKPTVFKYSYIPEDANKTRISVYDYNWQSGSATLRHESVFEKKQDKVQEIPGYVKNATTQEKFQAALVGVVTGVAILQGALTVIPILASASTGLVVYKTAVAAAGLFTAAIVGALGSFPEPSSGTPPAPYPQNVPVSNPTAGKNDPTPNLPKSPCDGVAISMGAGMDEDGRILVYGVSGGKPPYQYAVDNLKFQTSEFFLELYNKKDPHTIYVKDANGCMSGMTTVFASEQGCLPNSDRIMQILTGGSVKKWKLTNESNPDHPFSCERTLMKGDVPSFTFYANGKWENRIGIERKGNLCSAPAPIYFEYTRTNLITSNFCVSLEKSPFTYLRLTSTDPNLDPKITVRNGWNGAQYQHGQDFTILSITEHKLVVKLIPGNVITTYAPE